MFAFIQKNIREIESSLSLRIFGFFLSFVHVLTFLGWTRSDFYFNAASRDNPFPLCWPFFESCYQYRLSTPALHLVLDAYLVAASFIAVGYLFKRSLKWAYFASIFLWLFKWLFVIQDFRFMANYHYMPFLAAISFLFFPRKLDIIRLLLVGFYISAGSLKLSPEWMTGADLFGDVWFRGHWIEISCVYVVFLELFVSLGLLSKNPWVFWGALGQFVIFHLFSWHIVGFVYPTIMGCLLSIFVLARFFDREETSLSERFFKFRLPHSIYAVLAFYTIFQGAPLFFSGDSSLTGEGRIFSLNMFDGRIDCKSFIISKFKNYTRDDTRLVPQTFVRIQCDPLLYWDVARDLCRQYKDNPDFIDIDLSLDAKHSAGESFVPLLKETSFCKKETHYTIFAHNSWILGDNAP